MESSVLIHTFCPEKIFSRVNTYITQVFLLENREILNPLKFMSRSLGQILCSENDGQKHIEIVREGVTLYQASKTDDWSVVENQLTARQTHSILSLPQNKEQIITEFYGRKLTHKLKGIFQRKNYPINKPVSLNCTQIPYDFYINGQESTSDEIFFTGINLENNIVVFESSYKDKQARVLTNTMSLEHTSQLSASDL